MNSFHRFYLHVSLERQIWNSKLYKINAFTKGTYLNEFMSAVRAYSLKKKRKLRQKRITKKKLMLNQLSDGKIKKIFTILNTGKSVRKCYF